MNEMLYLQLVEERFGLNIDVSSNKDVFLEAILLMVLDAIRFLEQPSYRPLALMRRITGQMLSSSVQCSCHLFSLLYYGSFSL